MTINLYDSFDRERREAAYVTYVSAPEFPTLVREAAQRGYRHAEIRDIHASADSEQWAPELFSWRGGLWVQNPAGETFTCKFCGAASLFEPIDQTPPADYCHPSDHGFV